MKRMQLTMKKVPYREGDWFAVPLQGGGYSVGIVARKPRNGDILLGYFFGPRRLNVPVLDEVHKYKASNAMLVRMFGDTALKRGEWPVLGTVEPWDTHLWPMPDFGRYAAPLAGYPARAWRVRYPENNPNGLPETTPITIEEYSNLPKDLISPPVALQVELTKLLGGKDCLDKSTKQNKAFPTEVPPTANFYLYLPNRLAAVRVLEQLQDLGYSAEMSESDANWLVLVTYASFLTLEELDAMEVQMETVAASEGGEYDGFERSALAPLA
jgi:hypothetical protein